MDGESGITLQEYIYSLQYIDIAYKEFRDKKEVSEILLQ
jgi:hypothetical protein